MSKQDKFKDHSPLVQTVLALDEHFANLERLSQKIGEAKLKSETEIEHVRKLMAHFAEHGEGVAKHITELAARLNEARARAEAADDVVSAKAELLQSRRSEEEIQAAAFQALAVKVATISRGLKDFRKPEGETLSDEERANTLKHLQSIESQLLPLIEEAQKLKREAHASRLSHLEAQAESLTQTLINVSQKLPTLSGTTAQTLQ